MKKIAKNSKLSNNKKSKKIESKNKIKKGTKNPLIPIINQVILINSIGIFLIEWLYRQLLLMKI